MKSLRGPGSRLDETGPLRHRLLGRIHRSYETVTQHFTFGSLDIEFTRIREPDRVLDQIVDAEDRRERLAGKRLAGSELHLPYWAELWDSALGISQLLLRDNQDLPILKDCDVLDLGCGMGLCGTVAAALGSRVLFADLEPPPLLFARLNSLPWRQCVRTRQLDWRKDRLEERFELILGADIVYERAQWEHLCAFWREHLTNRGVVLLGEPGRQTGEAFIPWIRGRGWSVREVQELVRTRPRPIRLLILRQFG